MTHSGASMVYILIVLLAIIAGLLTSCDLGQPCKPATQGFYEGCCFDDLNRRWCCEKPSGGWICNGVDQERE